MRDNLLPKIWMILLLLVTAVLLLAHKFSMNEVLHIDQDSKYNMWVYDDRSVGGASVGTLEHSPQGLVLNCVYVKQYDWPFCGYSIVLANKPNGVDLSHYDRITIDAKAHGIGPQTIRIHLRNFDPAYSTLDSPGSLKTNEIQYYPQLEENPLELELKSFQVASWWINKFIQSPKLSAPDLSNVSVIDISTGDSMEAGFHQIIVGSITFHGKWISYGQLLSFIIVLWTVSAILYLYIGFWDARKAMKSIKHRKEELENINAVLEIERNELKLLATHDPLTGALNRMGLRDHLYSQIWRVKHNNASLSIIFMDLDNLN